jgi:hypothetical protein
MHQAGESQSQICLSSETALEATAWWKASVISSPEVIIWQGGQCLAQYLACSDHLTGRAVPSAVPSM